LRDVFSVGCVSEDAPGKAKHGRQVAACKKLKRPLVAARDPGHKRFVAVIHRDAVVAIADARSLSTWPVCLTGGGSESCGASIPGKRPVHHA
jgi:hypothetical protein